ncbi:MAG: prepilin-type N-terminal cleavage/methylation domain-containing protein [Bacillaceae bacterium]|nr:prepilin-type N-terminal cleavage/methylation domain-containing protein [Bacillaceae bacterium]
MKNHSTNKGFTLFEMLIVLMILSVVISITYGSATKISKSQMRNHFIEQLYLDLYYAQSIAITHRKITMASFNNTKSRYVIRQGLETKVIRPYNANVIVLPSTIGLNDVVFLPDGNIQRSGSLLLNFDDEYYKLTILLGRGRFYIEKL